MFGNTDWDVIPQHDAVLRLQAMNWRLHNHACDFFQKSSLGETIWGVGWLKEERTWNCRRNDRSCRRSWSLWRFHRESLELVVNSIVCSTSWKALLQWKRVLLEEKRGCDTITPLVNCWFYPSNCFHDRRVPAMKIYLISCCLSMKTMITTIIISIKTVTSTFMVKIIVVNIPT